VGSRVMADQMFPRHAVTRRSLDRGMKKRYHDVCKSTEDSLGAMLQASLTSLLGCSFNLCFYTNDSLSEDEFKHPTTMTSPLVPLDLHS